MSLTGQLLSKFESQIKSLTLIPGDGGCFEVTLNGELIYSKLATGRHANDGEVVALVKARLERA